MKSVKYAILVSILVLTLSACKEESQPPTPNTAAALPANLQLDAPPEGAKDVAPARASMKDGDRVVIEGVVGGRVDPIAANRAILTLLDVGIATCDKTPSDGCKTPWDACCESADVRAKSAITVQVVNPQGQPLQTSLGSLVGVKPLARLSIVGTAKVSADGAVLVNADGIYVSR